MDEFVIKNINGLVYDQGKIYMLSSYIPMIMVYDFEKKKVSKLCNYPQDVEGKGAFEKMLKYESKIYLFPCRTDSIYYYDIQTQAYTKLLSFGLLQENMPKRKFFEVIVHDGLIYAVSRSPNLVICINPVNDDTQIWKLDREISISDRIVLVDFSICIYDSKLLYPYSTDMIIEFDLCDKNFQVVHLTRGKEDCNEKYRCLIGMVMNDLGKQYVYDWYGNVFEITNNEMLKMKMPFGFEGVYNDGLYEEGTKINGVLHKGDKLYFVLNSDYRILVYNIHSNCFSWIDNAFAVWKKERLLAYTAYTQMQADDFLLYNYNDGNIYVLNLNNGFYDKVELHIWLNDIINDVYMWEYWKENVFTQDNLKLYIQLLWKDNNDKVERNNNYFGEKIYFVLKNEDII